MKLLGKKQGRYTAWWIASLLATLPISAEPPNPFAAGNGAPGADKKPEFFEEDEFVDPAEGGFDLGAQPDVPPPPSTPPPARAEAPPAQVTAPPPQPLDNTPPTSRPAPRSRSAAVPTTPTNPTMPPTKAIPKKSQLADYLQLDSSVKGLQVKNFDLPDKEIRDVVTLISKWTGKNFIIDAKVRGKITILGPSQVTLEEAYQAFLSALEANGLTTVKAGKFIRIIESAEARRAPVETFAGDYAPDTDQFITRIFQLKYINADEVQREFRDLTTRQGKLFAYEPTNSIIITDTGSNIRRIEEILAVLDVKGFETKLHVLPIKHTSSKAIAEMLDEIYSDGKGGGGSGGSGRPRSFRRTELERTRGGGIISKIIPDEQTNSLVVLANQSGFVQLKQLVAKLDVKAADTGRIHVYYCEYAKAEDLAATLSALAGGGGAAPTGKSTSRRASVTSGNTAAGGAPGASGGAAGGRSSVLGGTSGPVSADLGDGVKITSDSSTNSLVITAAAGDFKTLKRVIRKLDIPRLQVFVETAILEVNMNKTTDYGVNLAASQKGRLFAGGFIGDPKSLTSLLSNGVPSTGISIPIVGGQKFSNTLSQGGSSTTVETFSFMGLLRLITANSSTSVLSTPQIIALDNEPAEFKVLDETPVQTSFVTGLGAAGGASGFAAGQGNIERLKTGIEIKLTPHVNAASKQIRLEIEQKIDSIKNAGSVPGSLQGVQIATTSRETNTSVVVKNDDFVMLGGLMSDKVDENVTKVPLLGDIPILGWLFKAKTYETVKTNLVILLRPKIIGTSLASAKLIDKSLENRKNFLEKNMGEEEIHKEGVGAIKKDLERQSSAEEPDPTERYRNNEGEDEEKAEKAEAEKSGDNS